MVGKATSGQATRSTLLKSGVRTQLGIVFVSSSTSVNCEGHELQNEQNQAGCKTDGLSKLSKGYLLSSENTQLFDGALQTICEKILDTELSPLVQNSLIEKKNK